MGNFMTDTNSNIPPSQCQVSGRVSFIGGKAAVDVTLRAYDRDLGGDKEIGTVVSDANGYYKILYSSAQLRESGKGAADLIVMAFATDGKLLLASDLQPGAPAILTLDLAIAQSIAEPSQYEQLRDAIVPRLRDTALQDLTDDNIQYLATVTGQDAKKIERLVYSARCAQELNRGASDPLPESVFFALSSQGLPTDPAALLREPRARLTQALVRSHADNIVAEPEASLVQKLRDSNSLLAKRAATVMTEPAVAREWPEAVADFLWHRRVEQELAPTTGQHLTVADLFATSTQPDSVLAEDKQRVVAELVASLDKPAQVDAASLKAKGFEAAEIATVERIFGLADLARQHLPMVRALNAITSVNKAATGSLAYLARLHSDDWRRHVEAVGTPRATEGENEDARKATYAAELEQRVESTFRTAVVAARIEQSRMALPEQSKPDLNTFFHNNPDFEFGKQYVHTILGEGGSANLDGVKDPLALKRSLLKLERTVKLTDNYRQQSALLRRGFTSAQAILQYGKRDFVRLIGGDPAVGEEKAVAIFSQADQVASTALHLALKHRSSVNLPAVISNGLQRSSSLAGAGPVGPVIPDLQTLFGQLDGASSDQCLTVLSPAAYFVDLLQFLGRRKLPSISITSPKLGSTVNFNADDAFAIVKVAGECETSGVTDSAVRITASGSSFFAASVSFAEDVHLTPGAQTIRTELLKSRDADAKVMAEATTTIEVVQLSAVIQWKDVFPADGSSKEIGVDEKDYALNVNGLIFVDGLSRFEIQVVSNKGKTVPGVIEGNTFRADIRNSALPGDTANFTVLLTAQLNGTEQVLSQFTHSLALTRSPVAGSIEITAPHGTISLKQDDISFEVKGNIAFVGTQNTVAILVGITATVHLENDLVQTGDGIITFGHDDQGNLNGKGTFRCPIDFGSFEHTGLHIPVTLEATLTFDPQRTVNVLLPLPVTVISTFEINAQKSTLLIESTEIAAVASTETPTTSALSVLSQRRPDLVDIELSCANSDTTLPYVDLVLETLERATSTAFPAPLILDAADLAAVISALKANHLSAPLLLALSKSIGPLPREDVHVDVVEVDKLWRIVGVGFRLSLSAFEGGLLLDWYVQQTAEATQKISGQSEHFISAAYDKLKSAGYPWALPLDLPAEESRTYLSHLGVSRARLIEVFDRNTSRQSPELAPLTGANFRSATERRGFTAAEMQIISGRQRGTSEPGSGLWTFWGFKAANLSRDNSIPDPLDTTKRINDGNWVDVLTGRVDVFLQQSGLSYDELRELLDMRFVNFTSDSRQLLHIELGYIRLVDGRKVRSSDLSDARLVGGDGEAEVAGVLDCMHRFVRLWRRTGWLMRDVDQAITLEQRNGSELSTVLDEEFVGFLDRSQQLSRDHFGRAETHLSLFATYRYRDYAATDEPFVECLYERLFLNKAIANPPDLAFELNKARDELREPQNPDKPNLAKSHLPHIAAACGVSLQDASLLLDWHGNDPKLTLALLSSMFWVASIARSTTVSVRNLLDLFSLQTGDGLSALWMDPQTVVESAKPVELGVKFSAITGGEVSAIRYWKPEGETGEHEGRLWDRAGNQLAKVRFQFETASGWQEQRLVTPVRIESGAVYVVSVNTNERHAFTDNGMVPSQIEGLKTSGDGLNGVTGDIRSFPTASVNNPNYHRDVRFNSRTVDRVRITLPEAIHAAGFTPAEALYLLAHKQSSVDSAAEEASVALLLGELRTALSAIDLETTSAQNEPDLDGSGVRRELISLGWHPQVIDEVLEVLRGVYSVALASLPPGLLPEARLPHVTYAGGRLLSTTVLSKEEGQVLLNLSQDPAFAAAAAELIALPEERIGRDLCSLEARDTAVGFEAWPSNLVVPPDLAKRLYYDAAMAQLHFIGAIDDRAFAQIKALPEVTDAFLAAITTLRSNYKTLPSNAAALLTQAEQIELLSGLATPPDRYRFLIEKLVPHRRYAESLTAVRNKLQTSLGMESSAVGKLLSGWLISSGGADKGFAIADFLNSDFVRSAPSIPVTRERFPQQFKTCVRLTKVAALVRKFKLTDASLSWLFRPSAGPIGWLDPNLLPAAHDESTVSIRPLIRAANLFRLRDALPDGDNALARIFAAADGAASREDVLEQVHLATDWNREDLAALLGRDGFKLSTGDALKAELQSEEFLQRMADCFAAMGRIGATAQQCLAWSLPEVSQADAADIRRLARSRHSESGWAAVSKPLRDALREQQRAALVAYLTGRDQLRDSTDMYDRYLIDVEMRPAAQTSRIKQACASVQSFVQRCLLNLEPDVPPEAILAEQWAWMKNYRVWEANRKVFLFPENWIEPELRDDKSEVFRQFESDLLQSDVTHKAGLEAFKGYAERLGDIARLTVVGMCDESADDDMRIVHLLGRDGSTPHRYYYRQWRIPPFSDAGYWTPWEEVAAGIDSEHVQIFKFAGAIHIAWPTVKAEGDKGAMKITMNFVRHRRTGWTAPKRGQGQLWWVAPPNIDETRGLAFRVDSSDAEKLQIVCRGALEPATAISPRPFALQVAPYEPRNSATDRPQKATLHVRNLAKYRDTLGRTYQWVAKDLDVKLGARFDSNVFVWGNDINNMGKLDIVNEPILDHLDTNSLAPPGDPPEKARHVAFVSFGVGSAANGKYGALGTRESFDVKQFDSFEITGDTVVEIIHPEEMSDDEKQTISSERPLEFSTIGKFVFDDLGLLGVSDAQGTKPKAPLPYRNTEEYLSVYREVAKRPAVPVGDPPQALTFTYVPALQQAELELQKETAGRFIATPPMLSSKHPAFISAYSDAGYDLIFRLRAPNPGAKPVFNSVPASCLWGTQLRRALGNDKLTRAMDLQRSFPAIPIKNGEDIDKGKHNHSFVSIDFDADLPWSVYNWETFFHVPIMVATQLTGNQRFEEAQRWFHLVFDPMSDRQGDDERRFWRFAPFQKLDASSTSIEEALLDLAAGSTKLQDQIAAWRETPFQPHAIARARPRAYQFFVVMKYLDNLIAWGDRLFLNDTIESINEATQLYLLASRILGRRPPRVAVGTKADVRTYRELQKIDNFSNALVELESMIPSVNGVNGGGNAVGASSGFYGLYFGIPANHELSGYWNTVEDRLFKVRNSLNIEGAARQLPLYEPPIDPAILVRATAAGVDIATVINDLQGPMPFHRFYLLSQKALELANEVKALGASLLSAIEKQDGEMLALMRSTHEVAMLKLISTVRQSQADEALLNVASLRKTRELIATRYGQYQRLLGKSSVTIPAEGVNARLESTPEKAVPAAQAAGGDTGGLALTTSENEHLEWLNVANNYTIASGFLQTAAGIAHVFPNSTMGGPDPAPKFTFGGSFVGSGLGALGSAAGVGASNANYQGNRSATIGGHKRRVDEWAFQSNLAAKELEQVDKQIAAADLRAAIASLEVKNHLRQMENADEIDILMRDKFSNQQLFRWMSGLAASLHFRAFQIAHAAARRAEKAYRFELGLEDKDSNFIRFGYWDSLKKGLLAGEALALDIKRMEVAYLDKNKRELEITKHVSLRHLDGDALLQLRANEACEFELPETLFDLDFPGHYFRRIKSVSISIPCVAGPYTSVSGTLTMVSSKLRGSAVVRPPYADESNYRSTYLPLQSIATSSGQNDGGLFELNFRDERYLPFEGGGAISRWRFALPKKFHAFDYSTISDLVIHVRYTARDGGESLSKLAAPALLDRLKELSRGQDEGGGLTNLISVRQDFAAQWQTAKNQPDTLVALQLVDELFPYMFRSSVQVHTTQFVWMKRDDKGHWKIFEAKREVVAEANKLPAVVIPNEVATATDEPWLIVTYRVDAAQPDGRVP